MGVRNNRIVKIKGNPQGLLNKGYVCAKGLISPKKLDHPGRLKYPLKRAGNRGEGSWKRISWPEALETICDNFIKLKEISGPQSIAFCQGMPKGIEHFALIRLANIFGSPNVVGTQDVCHAPREISGIHTCGFYPVADFHNKTSLAVLWGSNLTSTNEEGQICNRLLKQLKTGTELIIIDPRKSDIAQKAKFWLQIRPGTDNALALAFLNVIIEEGLYNKKFVNKWCHGFQELSSHVKQYSPDKIAEVTWVPSSLIRDTARYYASKRPAAIQWGNAIEQCMNTFDTSRALVCLMAICGNLDVPGGNIHANEPVIMPLGKLVRSDLLPSKRKDMINSYHNTIPRLMTVPPALFRKAVLDGIPYPVKGAYVHGTNPLLAYADSLMTLDVLKKLDFLCVSDIFMTPTASFADILLPAATCYEFNDIGHAGLGHGCILARPKVVDPPEECWPDIKIINELGKMLTSKEYWYEDYNGFLDELLNPAGIDFKQFAELGYLKGSDDFRKYEKAGFKTPTGKVELLLSKGESYGLPIMPSFTKVPGCNTEEYPLVLTSKKSRFYLHSSYRWMNKLREHCPHPETEIHPETAERFDIGEGDEIVIKTEMGEIIQKAHLTKRVHPAVVQCAYGWWFPEGSADSQFDWKRSNYNMLTSSKNIGKEFGTPNLKGIPCSIQKY